MKKKRIRTATRKIRTILPRTHQPVVTMDSYAERTSILPENHLTRGPPDNFLIPFQHGFHREVVKSANGKTLRVYYHTEDGTSLRSKKDVDPQIENTQGITRDDFDFSGAVLPLEDPTKRYQSVRLDQRTLPNN